ncbi:MAG: hypothetical protein K0S32_3392 [Bacteroidetes bacterium]|jgi:hypothetical protein|nr:hypothetical protein [Bacteroidota bacterium]
MNYTHTHSSFSLSDLFTFFRQRHLTLLLTFLLMYSSHAQLNGLYTVENIGGENFTSLTNAGDFFNAVTP